MSDYEGWSNSETWYVALWIDNDQHSYHLWQGNALLCIDDAIEAVPCLKYDVDELLKVATELLTNRLVEWIDDENPLFDEQNLYADLLTDALRKVNFREIARHLLSHDAVTDVFKTLVEQTGDEVIDEAKEA